MAGRPKKNTIINGYKECYRCKKMLPLDNFYKNPGASCGYRSSCKECNPVKTKPYVRVTVRKKRAVKNSFVKRDVSELHKLLGGY